MYIATISRGGWEGGVPRSKSPCLPLSAILTYVLLCVCGTSYEKRRREKRWKCQCTAAAYVAMYVMLAWVSGCDVDQRWVTPVVRQRQFISRCHNN